ncbi:hypothetical protein [Arthrobacter sp. ISL-5]|uniref:hypothetical protein n=1 Tax=Arthrobacter sp. ISL-5 TaxID=2819111 RepID=UPI001BEB36DD|nr:hypothetical protein [Arthrobacter sp. ISL-5]MBT2555501.1 hypothetical protein [Arthrobacter sp. ISL-5]
MEVIETVKRGVDVDPVTLGVVAATLVAKYFEKFAEKAGEETATRGADSLEKLVRWLRSRFSEVGTGAATVLEDVARVSDSAKLQQSLAEAIKQHADADSTFKVELEALVEDAKRAGVAIPSVTQSAVGDRNVQAANTEHSNITVSQGGPAYPPSPPRQNIKDF